MYKIEVRLAVAVLGLMAAPLLFGQVSAVAPANASSNAIAADPVLSVNPVTGLAAVSQRDYHPLTAEQRWQLYWRQNYLSVGAYFGPVFTSLVLDQSTGSPSQWGGGVHGYALRVASRTASGVLQGTVQASLAAGLHEDVRYISSQDTGFGKRTLHAIAFSFLTYNDQGHVTLNVANLVALYATTAISTTWLPGRLNAGSYTLTNGTAQVALAVPVNILQEFWPDIRRRIGRHRGDAIQ